MRPSFIAVLLAISVPGAVHAQSASISASATLGPPPSSAVALYEQSSSAPGTTMADEAFDQYDRSWRVETSADDSSEYAPSRSHPSTAPPGRQAGRTDDATSRWRTVTFFQIDA